MFDPTAIAVIAVVILGAVIVEAVITYRREWKRRKADEWTCPEFLRRTFKDDNDQAPYGKGTNLRG